VKTKTFSYKDDDLAVKVTVAEATVLQGIKRMQLRASGNAIAIQEMDDGIPDASARALLRRYIYPDMVAGTIEFKGIWNEVELEWPIDFELLLTLPFKFQSNWENAVYEVNPYWIPGEPDPKESDESPTTSTNDSPTGSKPGTETTT